jgi:hypothetical protein
MYGTTDKLRYPLRVAVARDLVAVVVIRHPSLVVACLYRNPLIVVICCPSLCESVFCRYVLPVVIHYSSSVIRHPLSVNVIRYWRVVILSVCRYSLFTYDGLPLTQSRR